MNITDFALKNTRLTFAFLFIIIVQGIITYINMPRAYDPGFTIRTAQVVTYFPGASPERVENLLTSQLENIIKQIPELDFVQSESRTGVSIIQVNIQDQYSDMRPIWDDLRRKINDALNTLPSGISGPFVNDDFGDVYGVVLTITGEGYDFYTLNDMADDIRSEIQRLDETGKVDIIGTQEERIFVEYSNSKLSDMGISPSQLTSALQARNIVVSGGSFNLGKERITLEPSGNFESLEDIQNSIIQVPGSSHLLQLKDIARVYRGYADPPDSLLHSSGIPAVALAISMRHGGNNIHLGEEIKQVIHKLEAMYPWGIEFDLVTFSPKEVDNKVSEFVGNLLQSIAVVSVIMLLSLGFRTGLVVSTLIPITMLFSMIVMAFFDIGFDQISLAALIIALGMLVDNGIVMSESILVQMEQGKKAREAALESARELRFPLLTASLTTSAAFLPIFLAESDVGEFTSALFKVVTITLICSWLVSLTIIPLLCVLFLKVKKQRPSDALSFTYDVYKKILMHMLNYRRLTLACVGIIFIVAMMGFRYVPKLFFPPADRLYFKVELEMPMGTSIHTMETIVSDIEQHIAQELKQPEKIAEENAQQNSLKQKNPLQKVTSWVSYIGNAGPRFILAHQPKADSENYALMMINVSDNEAIDSIMENIRQYAMEHHPDLDVTPRKIENGPSIENPVEVRLSSNNDEELFNAVATLKSKMEELGGLTTISDDWGQRIKKIVVDVNQTRALRAGVSSKDIATSLQTGLSGLELTEYREDDDIIPVLLHSSIANQDDIRKVQSLSVYSQSTNASVPLRQVADIKLVWDHARIFRRNGVRTVTVGAQLSGDANAAEKFTQLRPWLNEQKQSWSPSMQYEFGGDFENSGKANQSIADKLSIAGFIILLLLIVQFNSVRKSFIVLTTIPLALIGVVCGLLLGHSFFGFMTLLGIISLAGIVINNAIVLLERIQIELNVGASATEAIVTASLQRFRPILLTTATTVLGLLPLYFGGGEMWEPMALSIMGGLVFSTVLTLGLVPVLYALLYRVKYEDTDAERYKLDLVAHKERTERREKR